MKFIPEWLTLKNLKIGHKLAGIGLPVLLPLGVLSYIAVRHSTTEVGFTQKEIRGVESARPLRQLLRHVLQHRVLAARTLGGGGSTRGDLETTAELVDQAVAAVEALDQKYGGEL